MFHVSRASTALQRSLNPGWSERADPIHNSNNEAKVWGPGHRNHVDPIWGSIGVNIQVE